MPKPLKPSQIKKKKKIVPVSSTKPLTKPKVDAPPTKPPAPAGSAGAVVAAPKAKAKVPSPQLVNDGGKAFKEAQAAKAKADQLKKELAAAKKAAAKPAPKLSLIHISEPTRPY